jgi:hypothetical protein
LNHDSPLSSVQFDMMLEKAISIYEEETGHIERDELKIKSRPTEDTSLNRDTRPPAHCIHQLQLGACNVNHQFTCTVRVAYAARA